MKTTIIRNYSPRRPLAIAATIMLFASCGAGLDSEIASHPSALTGSDNSPDVSVTAATSTQAKARGVYVVWQSMLKVINPPPAPGVLPHIPMPQDEIDSIDASVYPSSPSVVGVGLFMGWDNFEPSPGVYNFADLDARLAAIQAVNKKIEISVSAGSHTPDWLFQSGHGFVPAVPVNTKFVATGGGGTSGCASLVLARPWDSTFIKRYNQMVTALANHILTATPPGVTPTYASLIRVVKLSGLNAQTQETRLPNQDATALGSNTPGGTCAAYPNFDNVTQWQNAGFTQAKLVSGFTSIAQNTYNAFTQPGFGNVGAFSLTLIPKTYAFPALNANGTTALPYPDLPDILAGVAAGIVPAGMLVIQHNTLDINVPANQYICAIGVKYDARLVFQTNNYNGTNSDPRYPGLQIDEAGCTPLRPVGAATTTCSDNPLSKTYFLLQLNNGIAPLLPAGSSPTNPYALFIEIHSGDMGYPTSLAAARAAIAANNP